MNDRLHHKSPDISKSIDAIALLTNDHAEVKSKFEEFDQLGERAHSSKKRLANKICIALSAHSAAEEAIFYPSVKALGKEGKQLVQKAMVEHASAKSLIQQIQSMDPEDEFFDAMVKVLSEQIEHHVKEEEDKIFPAARSGDLDLAKFGMLIAQFKKEFEAEQKIGIC